MTDTIPAFSTTEGGNNLSDALFPEALPPGQTTDNLRTLQAAIRRQWNQAQWFELGDLNGPATFQFLSSNSFRVVGISLASQYHVGRRVRCIGDTTGTIHGSISAVSASSGSTDVTVNFDTGSLRNESLKVELGILSAINPSIPSSFQNLEIAQDGLIDGSLTVSGNVTVGGDISADEATFDKVNFNTGPFNILSAVRRQSGSGPTAVPANTKQIIIEIWSPGGGASSGTGTNAGNSGGSFSVESDPSGVAITVPGGLGGGRDADADSGSDMPLVTGVTSSGTFLALLDMVNGGSPGGVAGEGGIGGLPGHYVRAILNATPDDITQFELSGGSGGNGASEGGDTSGGNGGRGLVVFTFYG